MNGNNSVNKKQTLIIVTVAFLVVVVIAILAFLLNQNQNTFEYDGFEYDGWIDCQPWLSESEADLCERAEAAGYPYITY